MRFLLTTAAILLVNFLPAQCRTGLAGTSTGKKLYVQNPAKADGAWCTDSVKLNGKPVAFEKAVAFEIDPAAYGIQPCDTMQLVFIHDCGCKPKLLSEMHPPAGTTAFTSVAIDSTGLLQWSVNFDCRGYAPEFEVEAYYWNAWQILKRLPQSAKPAGNYNCIVPILAGENLYRVKAKPYYSSNLSVSSEVSFFSSKRSISWQNDAKTGNIIFSDSTAYKMVTTEGIVISQSPRALHCKPFYPQKGSVLIYYDNCLTPIEISIANRKRKKITYNISQAI